jgi:hypothetical protein
MPEVSDGRDEGMGGAVFKTVPRLPQSPIVEMVCVDQPRL